MSYRRWLYHPGFLWLLILITLLPASLFAWALFLRTLGNGISFLLMTLLLSQAIIWLSWICLRLHRINLRNRRLWLKALTIPLTVHGMLTIIGGLISSPLPLSVAFFLVGPILASGCMWVLVCQSTKWQPPPLPSRPRLEWNWRSLPGRFFATVTNAKLPLPQPDDRRSMLILALAIATAVGTTGLTSHGLATNDLLVVSKRGVFHVRNLSLIPYAGIYICLSIICLSVVIGHFDKRPNAHIYRRLRSGVIWVAGALLLIGLISAIWSLIAVLTKTLHN